jgi:ATPase family associated with various cellular activities (AAA)/Winged helix domain, variant
MTPRASSSAEAPPAVGFAFLDARIRAHVEQAASGDPNPGDPLRGLYISDEQALALAADGGAENADARLADAAARLGLDALDTAVLGLASAPELDPRYGRLFAYLHDDVTRRLASPRLVANLLAGDGVSHSDILACFRSDAPLRRRGAIRFVEGDGTVPLGDRPAKLADPLAAFLLGLEAPLDPPSGGRLRRQPIPTTFPGREETVEELRRLLATDSMLPLVVAGADADAMVALAAERPLLLCDVRELSKPDVMADAALCCALEGRQLCGSGLERLEPAERAQLLKLIDEHHERLILLAPTRAAAPTLGDRTVLLVEVPMPHLGEREQAWSTLTDATDTSDVAAKFRLSLAQIAEAAEVATITAHTRGAATPEPVDLDLGARHASSSRLGELASQLTPRYKWTDLVLPDRQRETLASISAYLRHRDHVLTEWGYEKTVARTQGLKVLFAGESGTGKTMAAEVLGGELGLELFRVDLATIVSKYIGETEKNLDRIFEAATGSNAILFFDEADALFGKRSDVSDAHDRYANIEVAYLLQKMEGYPGAVILATNFRQNIDDAFVRRLDFVIDFPFPEPDDRKLIWRLLLPEEAPLSDDVDLEFLSVQFKLSGGAIRNCSMSAAFQAADEGTSITMRHLVRAVAQEFGKQGRLTLQTDFEQFHQVIGPGR